jgi:hypothetical protein
MANPARKETWQEVRKLLVFQRKRSVDRKSQLAKKRRLAKIASLGGSKEVVHFRDKQRFLSGRLDEDLPRSIPNRKIHFTGIAQKSRRRG